MPIQYALYDNRLTPDPDDRYAQVLSDGSVSLDDLADHIAATGSETLRSSVTRADVLTVLRAVNEAIRDFLADGARVNLPFAQFSVSLQGAFANDDDPYDPARHTIVPRVQPGQALRDAFRSGITVTKVSPNRRAPVPLHYVDLNGPVTDGPLTPGGMGRVDGDRLAFDPAVPEQGVFFVAPDGAETRVETFGQVAPSRLLFLVPALAAGTYRLEVRAAFGDTVRTGRLDAALTVA